MEALFWSALAFLTHWASAFWSTLRETSPFLVLGLVFAGVLHVLIPSRLVLWALGRTGWGGAVRGALIGLPLPLCSCGVVPTALALRRQGASLAAICAFTVVTPETSIDALAITAALLPPIFLGVRPLAAILLAIAVGAIVEFFSTTKRDELRLNVLNLSRTMDADLRLNQATAKTTVAREVCKICGLLPPDEDGAPNHSHGAWARVKAVLSYAFGAFFNDIAAWLIFGLIAAAFLQVIVPLDFLRTNWTSRYPAVQIALAIILGIPLHSCATATTPLVAVLLSKGLNPGAALAFLLAGPATNIGSFFALKRELGQRATLIYYAALLGFCWLIGFMFSGFWPFVARFPGLTQVAAAPASQWSVQHIPDWLEIACACLLLGLSLNIWVRAALARRARLEPPHDHHGHHHHDDGEL